jgi:hypothetical protein
MKAEYERRYPRKLPEVKPPGIPNGFKAGV